MRKVEIDRTKNTNMNNCFDVCHVAGALMVAYGHQFALLGKESVDLYGMAVSTLGVQILFCVSGYLVSKSYMNKPKGYFLRRIKRIYPEWVFYLIMMTFVIGPLVSRYYIIEYYKSKQTWLYIINNIVMNPEYYLPGVFSGKYLNANVNISIWTMPFEIISYSFIAVVGLLIKKIYKYGKCGSVEKTEKLYLLNFLWILPVIVIYIWQVISGDCSRHMVGNIEIGGGWRLIAYFAMGSLVAFLKLEKYLDLRIALCLIIILFYLPHQFSKIVLFFVVSYSILAFGISSKFISLGNIWTDSIYELYLWAFPSQQIVLQLWDSLKWELEVNILFIFSISLALLFAVITKRCMSVIRCLIGC